MVATWPIGSATAGSPWTTDARPGATRSRCPPRSATSRCSWAGVAYSTRPNAPWAPTRIRCPSRPDADAAPRRPRLIPPHPARSFHSDGDALDPIPGRPRRREARMDPGSVGVFIPIAAILAWGAVRIVTIQAQHKKSDDPETSDRLHALENEVGSLRQELGETQERLDFTERMLAQQRPPERLDEGK